MLILYTVYNLPSLTFLEFAQGKMVQKMYLITSYSVQFFLHTIILHNPGPSGTIFSYTEGVYFNTPSTTLEETPSQ